MVNPIYILGCVVGGLIGLVMVGLGSRWNRPIHLNHPFYPSTPRQQIWVPPGSTTSREKAFFDGHFTPFFRIQQLFFLPTAPGADALSMGAMGGVGESQHGGGDQKGGGDHPQGGGKSQLQQRGGGQQRDRAYLQAVLAVQKRLEQGMVEFEGA